MQIATCRGFCGGQGPYAEDIARVVDALANAGLPRRARCLALKFQHSIDPLVTWSVEHRPESDELSRTVGLVEKLGAPTRPIPYRVFIRNRALVKVLSAPLSKIPISISNNGYIHIDTSVFGGTKTESLPHTSASGRSRLITGKPSQ